MVDDQPTLPEVLHEFDNWMKERDLAERPDKYVTLFAFDEVNELKARALKAQLSVYLWR